MQENLLEHECVNSKEAESSSSPNHESCPRFVHVATSAERHLAFGDVCLDLESFLILLKEAFAGKLLGVQSSKENFAMMKTMKMTLTTTIMIITMPAKAPLRVIRKLHFPVLFQRNCKIEFNMSQDQPRYTVF